MKLTKLGSVEQRLKLRGAFLVFFGCFFMLIVHITPTWAQQLNLFKLVYISDQNGFPEVFAHSFLTGTEELILSPSANFTDIACSPDGNYIAINLGLSEIRVINLSDESYQVISLSTPAIYQDLDWSPSGSRIAFNAISNNSSSIYTANLVDSTITQVTTNGLVSRLPTWSFDGSTLAFAREESAYTGIFTISNNGSNETQITTNSGLDTTPDWSPISDQIAFSREVNGHLSLFLANVQSQSITSLISSTPSWFPVWSPDAQWIAFNSSPNGNDDIYITKPDGTNVQPVTSSPWSERVQCWIPNSVTPTPTSTNTPTATPSPTPTNTPTPSPTRTPPPLPWTCETVMTPPGTSGTPPGTGNLISNPNFSNPLGTEWQFSAAAGSRVSNELSVIPNTTGTAGAFYQPMLHDAIANTPYELRLNIRNNAASNYNFHLLVRDGSWNQRYSCFFTLAPAPTLQTFILRFRPQYPFQDMVVQGWLTSPMPSCLTI